MSTDIQYICKLIHESVQLPVAFLGGEEGTADDTAGSMPVGPLFADARQLLRALVANRREARVPVIHTTNFLENFVLLPVTRDGREAGTLIVGPSTYANVTEETVSGLLFDNHVPHKHQEAWQHYLQQLPTVPKMRLLHIGMLAHCFFYQERLDFTDVLEYNHNYEPRFGFAEHPDLSLSQRREEGKFHMDQAKEKMLFGHVQNGNKPALLEALNAVRNEEAGVLSKRSRLRSQKNLSYCVITLATRAAVEGGLHPETAYTLSDLYIQHIEELQEVKHVESARDDALLEFADRVGKSKQRDVSKAVAACRNFILDHLYEPITLEKLAEATGLHANYLSHLFKKETGVAVSEFIQRERVEEAKKLLALTDDPILQISARLTFCDQTYFNKVFKKYTGVTPKQYRGGRSAAHPSS